MKSEGARARNLLRWRSVVNVIFEERSDAQAVEAPVPEREIPARRRGNPEPATAWTIPLLCAGVALIACCCVIPAADENRRLVWERERLKADLAQIEKQVAVNNEFLARVADDSTLLERLAQRQMKLVREGTSVLELKGQDENQDVSPYPLLTVPPPEPIPTYRAIGGVFSELCRHPRSRLLLMGGGLMLIACGLVLGYAPRRSSLSSM
jgi:hypothetical protein